MPQPTEQQFNEALQRVIATAPDGLSEDAFNALVDAEVSSASHRPDDEFSQFGPMRGLMEAQAHRGTADVPGQLPMIGGGIGGVVGNVPGAAIGGALGALYRDMKRAEAGDARTPRDASSAAMNVGEEAALQGGLAKIGDLTVGGLSKIGPGMVRMGRNVARSYLKPSLDAGRKEAARLFGRPAMAPIANEQIVERALQRGILGAENPLAATSGALDAVEGQLQKIVRDQPTRFNRLLGDVFTRSRNAALMAPRDVPAAQAAVEAEIDAVRNGSLGGKLDYGTARPPVPTDTVGAQPILDAMTGVPGRQTSPTRLIASHRPQNPTAREVFDWSRRMSKDNNWDKPASELQGWMQKAEESAGRSAVKDAVPAARPLLNEQGELLSIQRILPQAMNRELNKNTVARLPGMLAAVSSGNLPRAAGALIGTNLADAHAGRIAQSLYTRGNRWVLGPDTAETLQALIRAALVSQLTDQSPKAPRE